MSAREKNVKLTNAMQQIDKYKTMFWMDNEITSFSLEAGALRSMLRDCALRRTNGGHA